MNQRVKCSARLLGILFLATLFPISTSASILLGIAEALGLEIAQSKKNDGLQDAAGGEADSLGLQRPVELRSLPIAATFMVNSRLYRTNNMFKSEQDELIEDSSVFELGGTLSLSVSEMTFAGYNATPSLNLTHMRFFNTGPPFSTLSGQACKLFLVTISAL